MPSLAMQERLSAALAVHLNDRRSSASQLAKELGRDRRTIGKLLHGEAPQLDGPLARAIATRLQRSVDEVLEMYEADRARRS